MLFVDPRRRQGQQSHEFPVNLLFIPSGLISHFRFNSFPLHSYHQTPLFHSKYCSANKSIVARTEFNKCQSACCYTTSSLLHYSIMRFPYAIIRCIRTIYLLHHPHHTSKNIYVDLHIAYAARAAFFSNHFYFLRFFMCIFDSAQCSFHMTVQPAKKNVGEKSEAKLLLQIFLYKFRFLIRHKTPLDTGIRMYFSSNFRSRL